MNRLSTRKVCLMVFMIVSLVMMTACGSDDDADARPTSTPIPQFAQVATSTESPDMATAVATAIGSSTEGNSESELNPTAVARGQSGWERLECASCHGENAEGGADSIGDTLAPALTELALSEDEFIDWLRTGGTLGNDHLFSTDRLSDNGGRNLYQYILSLNEDQ